MESFDFLNPTRQSAKGIIIIFGVDAFNFFKKTAALLFLFVFKYVKNGNFFGLGGFSFMLIFLAVLIALLTLAFFKYKNFLFHVDTNGFHLNKGIFKKETISIPKSKIQNVYIKQNLLQQLINVVSLTIETAGEETSEVEINALDKTMALVLKNELLSSEAKSMVENVNTTERVYYKVSIKKLILEGVSQNHIKSFIILLAFLVGLYSQFKDIVDQMQWNGVFGNWFQLDDKTVFSLMILNSLVFLILIVMSFLISLGKSILVNYNLKVIEQGKTLEISKGLLNKVSLNLIPIRIQSLKITNNRVKRYFGLNTLLVNQAMVDKKQKQSLSIIGLSEPQVNYLTEKIYPTYVNLSEKLKPESYYKRVNAIRGILIALTINLMAIPFFDTRFFLINLLIIPFIYLHTKHTYLKSYYTLNASHLTIGNGFIETNTNILELHKIQSVEWSQSIFQKRKNIASLKVFTASSKLSIPYIDEDRAKAVMDFIIFRVTSSQKNWM
jgi:putative membrane protein